MAQRPSNQRELFRFAFLQNSVHTQQQMQALQSRSLPRGLVRLWRQHSCVLLQRWQHTVADRPVDPFVAQLQSKTEAELAELLGRHLGEEASQRDRDADDTVRSYHLAAGSRLLSTCCATPPHLTWPSTFCRRLKSIARSGADRRVRSLHVTVRVAGAPTLARHNSMDHCLRSASARDYGSSCLL